MKRWLTGSLVVLLGLAVIGCDGPGSSTATYRTEPVVKGTLQVSVQASGTTAFPHISKLTFGSSGIVQEVDLRVGQVVTKGQSLAHLDASPLETQVLQARQNLRNAQKALQDYQDSFSDVEAARLRASVASAKAAVASAEDALAKAQEITEDQMAEAEAAVANAKLALKKAQQALTKVQQPSTGDELSKEKKAAEAAKAGVRNSQIALDNATNEVDIAQSDWDAKLTDIKTQLFTAEETYKSKFYARFFFTPEVTKTPHENLKYPSDTPLNANDVETAWNNLVKLRLQQQTLQLQAVNGRATAKNNLLKAQEALENARESDAEAATDLAEALELQPLDVESKEKTVAVASARLKQAEKDLAKLKAGPDTVVVQQKASALETAKANLSKAQADLEKQLKGTDPLVLESRTLAVETAQHSLKDAESKLAGSSIAAPFNGVISVVNIEKGLSVGANAVAVVVVDTSQVEVNASVDEVDVTRLLPGQQAAITLDALPGTTLRGRVNTIAPTARVQQGVVSYDLALEIVRPTLESAQERRSEDGRPGLPANPREQARQRQAGADGARLPLRDGMTAAARIIITEKADVLLVPLRALQLVGGQRVVEVLESGKPVQRQVQLGLTNDQFAEVLSGLAEGEQVVIPAPRTQRQAPQGGGGPGGIPRGLR